MNLQQDILSPAADKLNNSATAKLDARLLLNHALGVKAEERLEEDVVLPQSKIEVFNSYIARRAQGEPTSRIIGRRDFWQSTFKLKPNVFDPRPETELIVEIALGDEQEHRKILDLGTGTGSIVLSILAERSQWRGVGLDISPAAVCLAQENASALGLSHRVHFICANWLWDFSGAFDIITCNPPYIEAGQIKTLAKEVKDHDPHQALSGGADGLEAYRALARLTPNLLKQGGKLLLELGAGQAEAVRALFEARAWHKSLHKDLAAIDRVLLLEKK